MILNVTEEQKKLLESQGYMVVEFKLCFRKLGEMLIDYVRRWIDTWKAMVLFLQEKIFEVYNTLDGLVERLCIELKPYVDRLKDVYCEERKKYPFIRSLGRKYQPNFSYKVIYHRCRDRC